MRERRQIGQAFGLVLRELRQKAGLTQEQLGFESDMDRIYVSLLERGQRTPSLLVVVNLAKALGTSAAEIVALTEQRMASKRR
jgi:transcriptional regulator with XRE-family HTH domain